MYLLLILVIHTRRHMESRPRNIKNLKDHFGGWEKTSWYRLAVEIKESEFKSQDPRDKTRQGVCLPSPRWEGRQSIPGLPWPAGLDSSVSFRPCLKGDKEACFPCWACTFSHTKHTSSCTHRNMGIHTHISHTCIFKMMFIS